jgi:hypothetical protein
MKKLSVLGMITGLALGACATAEAQFDGSVPLLCAPSTVLECGEVGECRRATAEDANLPRFVKIDVGQRMVSAVGDSARTSPIVTVERADQNLVLQGGQNGRGWSAVIAGDTGLLSFSVTAPGVGFVVFGACMPLP